MEDPSNSRPKALILEFFTLWEFFIIGVFVTLFFPL